MLFNSYTFIYLFLPVAVIGFYLLGRVRGGALPIAWLVASSLFFYGWWNPAYLGLIALSITANYALGLRLSSRRSSVFLALGVVFNLGMLGYFKYANFFVSNANHLFGSSWHLDKIVLPLAISFFTFQQVAYLVDSHRGEVKERSFLRYCLFVTFFPQLIAGPIVHHKEMLPQFGAKRVRFRPSNISVGLTLFLLGLFKKVVLADEVAQLGTPMFDAALGGKALDFSEAWIGTFAYTLQLYFDFSGYSDMAIGLARLFGIVLPLNFNSPYRATNIIEFWRRWHVTLSRFLRDYVYFSLGGNKKGATRRYVNLMATMILGGLWHGAAWTFVAWGFLHGLYLVITHAWGALRRRLFGEGESTWWGRAVARAVTMLGVMVGWVFFRAESFDSALSILGSMIGLNGVNPPASLAPYFGLEPVKGLIYSRGELSQFCTLLIAALLAFFSINTQQLLGRYRPVLETYPGEVRPVKYRQLQWRATPLWALIVVAVFVLSMIYTSELSEFLYYQF